MGSILGGTGSLCGVEAGEYLMLAHDFLGSELTVVDQEWK